MKADNEMLQKAKENCPSELWQSIQDALLRGIQVNFVPFEKKTVDDGSGPIELGPGFDICTVQYSEDRLSLTKRTPTPFDFVENSIDPEFHICSLIKRMAKESDAEVAHHNKALKHDSD